MNDEHFKTQVRKRYGCRTDKGRVWTGLFMLVIGLLLLARTSGFIIFPYWFFTWPTILIGIGFFLLLRHGLRSPVPFILMLIGGVFLADKIYEEIYLKPYFWPIVLIAAGIFIMLRPKNTYRRRWKETFSGESYGPVISETKAEKTTAENVANNQNDVIDIAAVFGGVKKKVLSKNFKGGDIVAIMGGTEINLSQADFNGTIMIDIFNMFGGTKLIIPSDWDVQSQVVAIFGGVDDKRAPATNYDPSKVILLEGTCIFGGIEIRNF